MELQSSEKEAMTEIGGLFSDDKGWKLQKIDEGDQHSVLSDKLTETSTIVGSVHTRRASICMSNTSNESCVTLKASPGDRASSSSVTLEKLQFRIRYALNCIRYPLSNKRGHRPSAVTHRIEKNWWRLENEVWFCLDPTPTELEEAARNCAVLVECVKYGSRSTQERALDAIGHLTIKYSHQLRSPFLRADAVEHIQQLLFKQAERNARKSYESALVSASDDTLVLRCRRTLRALQYEDGCELFGLHVCVCHKDEDDAEAHEATRSILQRVQDPEYSFMATRITTATVYNKPGLIPDDFLDTLHQLLDHIPKLHDPLGMDYLYTWTLQSYKTVVRGDTWTYTIECLESEGIRVLRRLLKALNSKEHATYVKNNMPNTRRISNSLRERLSRK